MQLEENLINFYIFQSTITMSKETINSRDIDNTDESTKKLAETSNTDEIIKYIENYRESKNWKKLRDMFNKLLDKDKMALYKDGWLNIGKYLKMMIWMWTFAHIQSLFNYESWKLKACWPELSIIYRFLVHMGVLDNPWIPHDEFIENVKKDSKFINIYMTVLNGVCAVAVPEAKPFVAALKPVTKTLTNKATEIAEKQQNNTNETIEEVERETKESLNKDFINS